MQGFDHREFLDRLKNFAPATQTCSVNQLKFLAIALKRHGNRVPGRPRQIERDQPFFTQPGVDQRGLSDIGTTGNGQLDDARLSLIFNLIGFLQVQRLKRQLHQRVNTLTVRCGNRMNLTETKLKEFDQLRTGKHALCLVGRQYTGFTETAKVFGDLVILRRNALPCIHHKDDNIRFRDRLASLFCHFLENAIGGIRLETAGVDDNELVFALFPVAVMTVPGQSGEICNDGIT